MDGLTADFDRTYLGLFYDDRSRLNRIHLHQSLSSVREKEGGKGGRGGGKGGREGGKGGKGGRGGGIGGKGEKEKGEGERKVNPVRFTFLSSGNTSFSPCC